MINPSLDPKKHIFWQKFGICTPNVYGGEIIPVLSLFNIQGTLYCGSLYCLSTTAELKIDRLGFRDRVL